MKLYRAMKVGPDGRPVVGPAANLLGVRPGDRTPNDVNAVAPSDLVVPGTKDGMSVAPNDPANLIRHRRPAAFGGTGKEPVWIIDDTELPPELRFRQDAPDHGLIEPATVVTLAEYQKSLESTRDKWQLAQVPSKGGPP